MISFDYIILNICMWVILWGCYHLLLVINLWQNYKLGSILCRKYYWYAWIGPSLWNGLPPLYTLQSSLVACLPPSLTLKPSFSLGVPPTGSTSKGLCYEKRFINDQIQYNTIQYSYYLTGLLSDNGLVQLADIETYTSRMAYRRSEAITGSKLPSSREMLSRFSYLHTVHNKTVQESPAATANEIIQFWEKSCIATR